VRPGRSAEGEERQESEAAIGIRVAVIRNLRRVNLECIEELMR